MSSQNGFVTSIWGPMMWSILHIISFNFPVEPTEEQKDQYFTFFNTLKYVLPCGPCRQNLANTLKKEELYLSRETVFENRQTLSYWVYKLHCEVNELLDKDSPPYESVVEFYEHFRAKCSSGSVGCTEPQLTHPKSKCILYIVPENTKTKLQSSIQVTRECTELKKTHI